MAEGGSKSRIKRGDAAAPRIGAVRTPVGYEPLVTAVGGEMDFANMLAIADILPVMVCYVDTDLNYRFINKPLADWLGWERKDALGKHLSEVLGGEAYEQRKPMYEKALAGERVFFASEFDHPERGR